MLWAGSKVLVLTSGVGDFITVDVIEKEFVTACLLNVGGWATTTIIRMFGKAVKIRHCPATVNAPWKQEISRKTTGATGSGKVAGQGC